MDLMREMAIVAQTVEQRSRKPLVAGAIPAGGSIGRRGFLRALAMGAFGLTLDVDRLLWGPGAKTIFIPSVHHNALIGPEWVMREVARQFVNNLKFAANINRSYDRLWVNQSLVVAMPRLPARYAVLTGNADA